jgi:Mg2+ and Co2+ transporter CorA|tara:strand:- start:51 stop:428 length:378 start_codon:yes stop_codon:yes gene_type:complete
MADATTDNSRNEVQIDLDKYMNLVDKLDKAEDTITELKEEAKKARDQLAPPKRKFMDLFLDDNDINEKAIIGFISFFLMFVFGMCDLITAFWGMDLQVSDTIYTSFVVVTLGAFGISEAGKAFGK